jgi:hypothetical protein
MLVRRVPSLFLSCVAALGLVAACTGSSPGEPTAPKGSLVVGIQADDFGGLIDRVHIVATVAGKVTSDVTIPVGPSAPNALPKEIVLEGAPGDKAEVVVDAAGATPVVTKRAAALLVANTKKLLRMQLETRCMTFSAPGSTFPIAPVCDAPQTCASGRCISEEVAFDQLESYEPGWATSPPDICRPANHGAPELFLGTGQTDFAPLNDGQTLQLERGPQGGHHIWIAARMKNLRQSGSRTMLTAKLVGEATSSIPPAAYVFTFDRDEGNYCKLWGLRYQLDSGATDLAADYKRFLGKQLEVTVEVTDSTNAKATSTKTIHIADLLLCPDGTTSCN